MLVDDRAKGSGSLAQPLAQLEQADRRANQLPGSHAARDGPGVLTARDRLSRLEFLPAHPSVG